ncbi:hypothetical protein [Candidatus Thiodictyon syntrophicum]|jgi:hypothetical protein|uniref:hypothetical protein n=1 Tax=Candidatus Thiodictyon syntrophicum TaxID=1166950 RepID=UPI0012FD99E1|nr:hypothetical protein [Candidatus Thiodictyon syntrophicum]
MRLIVTVKPESSGLLEMLDEQSIAIDYCPQDICASWAFIRNIDQEYVEYRLLEGVQHLNPLKDSWGPGKPIRLFLYQVHYLIDDDAIALVASLNEPSEFSQCLPPEVLDAWKKSMAKRKSEEKIPGDKYPEKPGLLPIEAKSLRDLLPKARYMKFLPQDQKAKEQAIQRSIDSSEMGPSRDGAYAVSLGLDVAGQEVAVIAWEPESDLPGYPELRECLSKSLPSAFKRPRHSSVAPPILLDTDSSATLSNADLSPADNILDQDEFISASDYRLSDNSETAARVRALIQQGGFEALGWYQGFHSWGERHWGIYLHADRIYDFACALHKDLSQTGNPNPALGIFLAAGLVYQHERFHARVEAAATWIETLRRKPLYRPYHKNVYQRVESSADWREEALANWTAIDWMRRRLPDWHKQGLARNPDDIEQVVAAWLDLSPAGYRDWRKGQEQQTWRTLASELVTAKQGGGVRGRALPVEALLRGPLPFDWRSGDIPTRFIGSSLVSDIFFSSPSRREAIKVLALYEYQVDTKRGKGSHEFWEGKDGRGFPLPMRDPLSIKVFSNLLDHFGLTKKEYVNKIRPRL